MKIIMATVLMLALVSCEMPDEDRCSAPLIWDAKQAACITEKDTDEPKRIDTSPVQEGLGAECWKDADCATFAPDGPLFCLLDPIDETVVGMCTFTECDFSSCGGDYECCDCRESAVAAAIFEHTLRFCADAATAKLLSDVDCECE